MTGGAAGGVPGGRAPAVADQHGRGSGRLWVVKPNVNSVEAPLGVDDPHPEFSWQLRSNVRDQKQTAYRVIVATSKVKAEAGQGDMWDSGRVSSDCSLNVKYAGRELKSQRQYFWSVEVWGAESKAFARSPACGFGMGVLDPSEWRAHWIRAPLPPTNESAPPLPYLRRSFDVNKPVERALLRVTSLGYYEAHLNGRRVTQDEFLPAWTGSRKRVQYRSYDVTRMLRRGKNVIGALLGPGFHAGWIPPNVSAYARGDQPLLYAQLRIEYADGSSSEVVTDGSWKTKPSPILASDVYMGESFDARQAVRGWDTVAFDDSGWRSVAVDDRAIGSAKLDSSIQPAVRRIAVRRALRITEPEPGHFVFDFGQNMSGRLRLRVRGSAGTTITMKHGEVLYPDGRIYTRNLRLARATDQFTLAGNGVETFEPTFTYHGFRYAELIGYPGRPSLGSVRAVVLHTHVEEISEFESSNQLINRIEDAGAWTALNNMFTHPTDCNQRDERLPFVSQDLLAYAQTWTYITDGDAYFANWMRTVDESQRPSGAYPWVVPDHPRFAGTPGHSDAAVELVYMLWQQYGNTRVISRHWASLKRYLKFLEDQSPDNIGTGASLGDWLSWPMTRFIGQSHEMIATGYLFYMARVMSEMGAAISEDQDAAHYRDLAHGAWTAFNREFVTSEGRVRDWSGEESQTGYVMALWMGLLPEVLRAKAADHLVVSIEANDMHLTTGFLAAHKILPVLTATGHNEIAYALIKQTTVPSWGYMIERWDATTIWERWDSIHPDGTFAENDPPVAEMNSFNHLGYAGVGMWLYETAGGIVRDASSPGYKHFSVYPRPGGGLTYANTSHQSPYGQIVSRWCMTGEIFKLHVEIPVNSTATVYVPARSGNAVSIDQPGARYIGKIQDGFARYEVGSGSYDFTSRTD